MQVVVDGLLTNYSKTGAGPVVVLLHGWGDSLETFASLQKKLSGDYTVISVDLPGFGKTAAPSETFNLAKYAQFVHDFVDKIVDEPIYALIGHSNGGAISIKALVSANLAPPKLVLLASSGVRSTYKGRKKALRIAAKAAKLPTKLMPEHIQKKLKKKAYASIGSEMFVAEHLQQTFKEVVGEDLLASTNKVQADTLLLYGSKDTATLPAFGELFADKIQQSELHIIEGADHFLHHTHAPKVESLIAEFLERK